MMMRRLAPLLVVLGPLAAQAEPASPTAPDLPRLTGTVIAPNTRQALLVWQHQPYSAAPGDDVGVWTVQSIGAGHVVLIGPQGPVDLSLAGIPPPFITLEAPFAWTNPCGRLHGLHTRHGQQPCRAAMTP